MFPHYNGKSIGDLASLKGPPVKLPMPGHFPLYDISYVWYMVIGASLTIIIALISTIFSSKDVRTLDRKLLSPVLPKLFQALPKQLSVPLMNWWNSIGIEGSKENMEMSKCDLKS